jgi:hypothetical protein
MGYYNGIKLYIKKKITTEQWNKLRKIKSKFYKVIYILSICPQSLYLFIKYSRTVPKNYLSVVAIIKNEGAYITEWLEYHLITGVSKFYIYDNESEDNLKEILQPYIKSGIVEYIYCPGRAKQVWAYNDILKKAREETYWLAVIDCDEFIVPISAETIPEALKEFEGYGGVGINWLVYGSGGQKTKTDGLVVERFKDHSVKGFDRNVHIKTIVNARYVIKVDVHNAFYIVKKYCVNTKGEKIEGAFNYNILFGKMRINHYFTKSYEEFLQKRQRGMATHHDELRPIKYFYDHDRNEERNDKIMDKYIPIIYENIKEKDGKR